MSRLTRAGLWLAPLLLSCEQIVSLDLDPVEPRLVIDGRIEHVKGTAISQQRVSLTLTDDVFNNRLPPAATGAVVTVTEEGTGQTYTLVEGNPGEYAAMFGTAVGEVYTLSVTYDGEVYVSTDTLRSVPAIDSLYFEYEEANLFVQDSGFRPTLDIQDPPGVQNFYRWEFFIDGQLAIIPDVGNQFNLIASDEVTDGTLIEGFQPGGPPIEPGQTAMIRQLGISAEAYDYMFALFQQAANGEGSPFSVPPADIRGNVGNLTRPDHFPLGWFFTVEVAEITEQLDPNATR